MGEGRSTLERGVVMIRSRKISKLLRGHQKVRELEFLEPGSCRIGCSVEHEGNKSYMKRKKMR